MIKNIFYRKAILEKQFFTEKFLIRKTILDRSNCLRSAKFLTGNQLLTREVKFNKTSKFTRADR